jgi:hypothetical protein
VLSNIVRRPIARLQATLAHMTFKDQHNSLPCVKLHMLMSLDHCEGKGRTKQAPQTLALWNVTWRRSNRSAQGSSCLSKNTASTRTSCLRSHHGHNSRENSSTQRNKQKTRMGLFLKNVRSCSPFAGEFLPSLFLLFSPPRRFFFYAPFAPWG